MLYGDTTQDIWIVYATKRSGRFFAARYVERKTIFQNDKKIAWPVFYSWQCIVHIPGAFYLLNLFGVTVIKIKFTMRRLQDKLLFNQLFVYIRPIICKYTRKQYFFDMFIYCALFIYFT